MQDSIILQRFRQLREMLISADMPVSELMDLIEHYITAGDGDDGLPYEAIPVHSDQLTLENVA